MRFKDLYNHVSSKTAPPIFFDTLADLVRTYHQGVGTVAVFAVTYPTPLRQAHYRMVDMDRSSPYDEEYGDVEISYCEELDQHFREKRYALTKELMHVFDTPGARVDSREKFVSLLKEIQNQPLPSHASEAFMSEMDTRWMAAIILCPKHLRDARVEAYRAGKIQDFDIAEEFKLPEWVVPFIMDDYYDRAFEELVGS